MANPMIFIDAVGGWVADLVAARVTDIVRQELEKSMSAVTDSLDQLSNDVQALHDAAASVGATLSTLTQQVADLQAQLANAGADPAILQKVQQIDATVKDAQAALTPVTNPAPAPPAPPAPTP